MSEPTHAERLQHGVESWNDWRVENMDIDPDLRGINLNEPRETGAALSGVDLSGCDLTGANLGRATLRDADMSRADMTGIYLRKADLRDANLFQSVLDGANLSGANLSGVNVREASLDKAELSGVNLRGAYLLEAKGLFAVPGDRWIFYAVRYPDGPHIFAGCHSYTVSQALVHWRSDSTHDRISRCSVKCAVELAKVRGWEMADV